MYDYNFPQQLTQKRLTLLLLSLVIPTDTAVLKDIYKKKRELEDNDYSYRYNRTTNGYWDGKKWHKYDAPTREKYMKMVCEYSKSLTLIRCLYPNFIMYAKGEYLESPYITYSRIYNLYPLKEMIQEYPLKNAVSVLNYIVDNWEIAHNDYLNNSNGWRIKPSIVDYTGYIVFDILDGLLSDFKSKIQDVNSMEQLVDLVEDTGILYDECGFINF
jgi:hypothetical protein